MKAMNKKGIELSLNMIVVVIIAIATLFIALGFITGFLPKLFGMIQFPDLTEQPTATNPITFIPAVMDRNKQNPMTVGFYNNELADIDKTVKPAIICDGLEGLTVSAAGVSVPVGQIGKYSVLVTIPKTAVPGQYSCTITVSSTEKTFFLTVQ